MSARVFRVIFEANLRRMPGGTVAAHELTSSTVREFLHSPVLLALMESPGVDWSAWCCCLPSARCWAGPQWWASLVSGPGGLGQRAQHPAAADGGQPERHHAAQQYADGSLRNAEVIESMGMLRDIHRRWVEKQREFLGLQALASERAGGYQALTKFIQTLMGSLLLGLGAWLLLHDGASMGAPA
jgi:ATP-binding cassette subfamily C exporter for protease/lipase